MKRGSLGSGNRSPRGGIRVSIGCPPVSRACGGGHSRFFVDLLEYQGKQLFSKHGVPIPDGRPATTVEEAVEAAEDLGYPVVIKAQVLIGGRGKAGGIKLAHDRADAEQHAGAILGMD